MRMSKSLVVFLHGSGGTGPEIRSFLDTVPLESFGMKTFRTVADEKKIEFVCPTAVKRPYTPALGERMNVWFDREGDFNRKGIKGIEDLKGADNSVEQIVSLLGTLQSSYEHVFVGGFSQGGCLGLHMIRAEYSERRPPNLRGVFSMGSYLVEKSVVLQNKRIVSEDSASDIPILMMHGEQDSLIRLEWGERTATSLLLNDWDVQFKAYPDLDHEIGVEELTDLLNWIDDVRDMNQNNNKKINPDEKSRNSTEVTIDNTATETSATVSSTKLGTAETSLQMGGSCESDNGTTANTANIDRISGITSISGSGLKGEEHPYVPYTLSYESVTSSSGIEERVVTAAYSIPENLISLATARPILACGGSFELKVQGPPSIRSQISAVTTIIVSSDPEQTAKEIGKRLFIRLGSDGASLQACPMS